MNAISPMISQTNPVVANSATCNPVTNIATATLNQNAHPVKAFVWKTVNFICLPAKLVYLIFRFLWNIDDHIEGVKEVKGHLSHLAEQSDRLLSSLNESQLISHTAESISHLEAIIAEVRRREIVTKASHMLDEIHSGELIAKASNATTHLNHLLGDVKEAIALPDVKNNLQATSLSLRNLMTDMVVHGVYRTVFDRCDQYSKTLIDHMENFETKEDFETQTNLECQKLQRGLNRWLVLAKKAEEKGCKSAVLDPLVSTLVRAASEVQSDELQRVSQSLQLVESS